MNINPPKWADRFLAWYCNPDLLEEIQGDAHELYYERLRNEGKISADRKYIWDVLRFFRWSNIKRTGDEYRPGYLGILWNLNFKIALRNALQHKLIFSVKMVGLSVCLAFALIVSAFVIHEFTFDRHYPDHDKIFRVGTQANLEGVITDYAVSPVALADGLAEEIPDLESACWLMYHGKPAFTIGDEVFNTETTLLASRDLFKVLTFEFIHGTAEALDEPNMIVLTETTAGKFFGDNDPLDQTINVGWTQLQVAGVIKDLPLNSHLQFDALISGDTYDFNDGWDNVNAYTYIKLHSGISMQKVAPKIRAVLSDHREDMEAGRDYWTGNSINIYPIIEKISDIHLSPALDEDIAEKRTRTHIFILMGVAVLFFITGLINFLNLSLAELTANLKKLTILQVFGGSTASHNKMIITNTALSIFIVLPLTLALSCGSLLLADSYLSMRIEGSVFVNPVFLSVAGGFVVMFIFSSRINSFVHLRSNDIIVALKGKLSPKQSTFSVREFLVSAQLSFSIIMIALIVIIVDQFRFINRTDKGFEDKHTVVIKMRDADFSRAEVFEESVRRLSGVQKVDANSYYLDNIEIKEFFEIDTEKGPVKTLVAYMNCGYDYLEAMNIDLVSGRNFQHDHNDNKTAYIINETAAEKFEWKEPVGQRIRGPLGSDRDEGEVIGVVKDFHFASLHNKIEPLIIFLVNKEWGVRYVYVKVHPGHPADLLSRIAGEYKKNYPDLPFDWEYLDVRYANLYQKDYEVGYIFQAGLVISILVSCLGVFSISALLVLMRSKEMGIRKVVGANQMQLVLLHIRRFVKFIAIALLIAWPAIFYLSRQWLDNFAYHIDLNIWYFIVPGLIAFLIIIITSGFHGIKSAHVNPIDILKHE